MSSFDKHIGHRKHYQPSEVESLFRQAGYIPVQVSRAGFPFFNLYRCLVVLRGRRLLTMQRPETAGPRHCQPALRW